ncbi:phosphodiester glycosidase family protein [Mesorhizobium sp. KR1-2]|uniref:phosphodiester glycosidase family protein n=1 Tax=Mesorhizobium sp. KR1-2 TaxID=3156609 RepID=UPI0032B5AA14
MVATAACASNAKTDEKTLRRTTSRLTKRSTILGTALLVLGCLAVVAFWPKRKPVRPVVGPQVAVALPAPCRDLSFEGTDHIVCEIDLRSYDIGLFHKGAEGKPYRSLRNFDAAMSGQGRQPLLSMNAGMYHEDLSAVGLLVEDGRQTSPIDLSSGIGNFFMKPNGVFSVRADGTAAITESGAYAAAPPADAFATQSGPLLVIDGQLHPRFEENGSSRYIRNGVGVRDPQTVVLAISRQPVSFGSFGRLFRDALACPNALYFDGAISALSNGKDMIIGGAYPVGPILAVFAKQ